MSHDVPLAEPLAPATARRVVRTILGSGSVSFSDHALAALAADDLTTVDCTSVSRGGVVEPGELVRGSWRYRVSTARMCVVVTFRSARELRVVTAWRNT